ncbi:MULTISPECIES: hypothetical protein [Enterobacterales]|uniref:hypothetical protein n=1 Tax=Enterobacterales TaxID=91347 RepID=UPI002ED8768A
MTNKLNGIIDSNMKGYCTNLLKQPGLRIVIVATRVIIAGLIMFAVNLPFRDMIFITQSQDCFWFNGKRIACLAGAPLLAYCIFMGVLSIFSETHHPPKKLDAFDDIVAITSVTLVVLLSMIATFLHFYILLFSPFKPCEKTELNDYYVIDYSTCARFESHVFY